MNLGKFQKLHNSKRYALLRINVMEIIGNDRVLGTLEEKSPEDTSSTTNVNPFNKMIAKERAHIAFNLKGKRSILLKSLHIPRATYKAVYKKH